MYYRKDVFLSHNVSVPNTWDEYLEVAQLLNGTDFDGDGVGDYSLCHMILSECLEAGVLLGQILAPLTQYQVGGILVVGQTDTISCLFILSAFCYVLISWKISKTCRYFRNMQGLQSGWLFDPNDLSNFVSSPAMARALDMYQRLLPFLWPDGFCTANNQRFDAGQCAMNIKWAEGFKVRAFAPRQH